MKTYTVKKPGDLKRVYKSILKGIASPFISARRMFLLLGTQIDRDTMLTFNREGAYQDRRKWKSFNNGRGIGALGSTTRTKKWGTWKIRYGTDKKPKRNKKELAKYKTDKGLWYKPGPMKGYRRDRRYESNSKLLQASGKFKETFKIIRISKDRMKYGTLHRLATQIMSNPTRPTVQYTKQDQRRYTSLVVNWWAKNMKI